jgi:hypothetical protein
MVENGCSRLGIFSACEGEHRASQGKHHPGAKHIDTNESEHWFSLD